MTASDETPVYLAADCGGTNCRVRLFNEDGALLSEGLGGPSNASLGLEPVLSEVFRATRNALARLNGATIPLSRLHAGLAIAGLVEEERRQEFLRIPHPFASMTAETDAFVAQLGAFAGGDGGLLITGTGSCAFAVKGDKKFYLGGWGFPVSDQGSGARLGHLAVRRALQAYDDILPTSPLCKKILAEVGTHPPEVSGWARTAKPADYGALASTVIEYAVKEDEVARSLVRTIAEEVNQMIRSLVRRDVKEIHHIGGFAEPIRPWLDKAHGRYLAKPRGDVFDGALRLINNRTGLINKTGKARE
ncbi:BadF/BadG/BcrA/BcrD ATPase family protein [Sneathiella litorea]|uniref:N-acetylglucosamine kinase n=1 Tax=Sneathiella litorea TaxID=2606216 RepID=A0A6L8W6Y3_9PROT|nr:BadF/BadG/BcrA/BcrD ATPase family protein [Sneathiella litorea]MZR30262.1 N-acetylglucosamine kinase [Sneathiella litorea]